MITRYMAKALLTVMVAVIVFAAAPYMLAYGQTDSDVSTIESSGSISSLNDAPHSGLWVAEANFNEGRGNILSIFKNNGDIYVVTVRGEEVQFDGGNLTISGNSFIARNGSILTETSGSATISTDSISIVVGEDFNVSGNTFSFETNH